jgi:hypothetical protein
MHNKPSVDFCGGIGIESRSKRVRYLVFELLAQIGYETSGIYIDTGIIDVYARFGSIDCLHFAGRQRTKFDDALAIDYQRAPRGYQFDAIAFSVISASENRPLEIGTSLRSHRDFFIRDHRALLILYAPS